MRSQIQQHAPRKHATGDQKMVMEQNIVARDGHWNPTLRMAQMRHEYDRLVKDLGVSPRGSSMQLPQHAQYDRGGALSPTYGSGMPRVPSDRSWAQAGGASSGTNKSARSRRFKETGAGAVGRGVGCAMASVQDDAATWSRVQLRINEMAVAGHITAKQAAQLKTLQAMQENLLREAQAEAEAATSPQAQAEPGPESESEADTKGGAGRAGKCSPAGSPTLAAAQELLGWLDDPKVAEAAEVAEVTGVGVAGEAGEAGCVGEERETTESLTVANVAKGIEASVAELETPTAAPPAAAEPATSEAGGVEGEGGAVAGGHSSSQLGQTADSKSSSSRHGTELPRLPPGGRAAVASRGEKPVHEKPVHEKPVHEKPVHERAREAAEAVLRPDDLVGSQRGKERIEEALRSGRLPSLSPDEGEDGGDGLQAGRRKEHGGGEGAVWGALEARLLPRGLAAAPAWQQSMLRRAQWRVDCHS